MNVEFSGVECVSVRGGRDATWDLIYFSFFQRVYTCQFIISVAANVLRNAVADPFR